MVTNEREQRVYERRRRANEKYLTRSLPKRLLTRIEQLGRGSLLELMRVVFNVRPIPLPIDLSKIKSILIIRNDAAGDMVLSLPVWQVLKKRYPHLRIGIVGSFRNLPVIAFDPSIDIRFDGSLATVRDALRLRKEIGRERWDVVLPLIYSKLTKMSAIAHWLVPSTPVCTVILPSDSLERYKKMFEGVVVAPQDLGDTTMSEMLRTHVSLTFGITITEEEWKGHLYRELSAVGPMRQRVEALHRMDSTSRVIYVNLEAKTEAREYGLKKNLEVSLELATRNRECSVVWTTSPASFAHASAFLTEHPHPRIHLIETESIHHLMALMKFVDVVLTPDTSVVHIAAAEGKPVVGLYVRKNEWAPQHIRAILLTPKLGEPVSSISPALIIHSIEKLLNGPNEVGVVWSEPEGIQA